MRARILLPLVTLGLAAPATALEPLHHFRERPTATALFRDATAGPASSLPLDEPQAWAQSLRRLTHRKRGGEAASVDGLVARFAAAGHDTRAALDAAELARWRVAEPAMVVPLATSTGPRR